MLCRQCGTENRAGSQSCAQCGRGLTNTCGSCGAVLSSAAVFCDRCGAPIAEDPGGAVLEPTLDDEPERRTLTVMFCDLVGSTSLAEALELETMRDVIRAD